MEDPYQPPPPPLPQDPNPDALGQNAGMRLLMPVGRSGWSIAAGYLGLFALVVVPAPLALIVSLIAIRDIRNSKNTSKPKHGMGRAIFGLTTGLIGTAILAFALYSSFAG